MNIFDHKGIALMLLFVAEIFLVNIIIKICNFLFSDNQREINSKSLQKRDQHSCFPLPIATQQFLLCVATNCFGGCFSENSKKKLETTVEKLESISMKKVFGGLGKKLHSNKTMPVNKMQQQQPSASASKGGAQVENANSVNASLPPLPVQNHVVTGHGFHSGKAKGPGTVQGTPIVPGSTWSIGQGSPGPASPVVDGGITRNRFSSAPHHRLDLHYPLSSCHGINCVEEPIIGLDGQAVMFHRTQSTSALRVPRQRSRFWQRQYTIVCANITHMSTLSTSLFTRIIFYCAQKTFRQYCQHKLTYLGRNIYCKITQIWLLNNDKEYIQLKVVYFK